MGKNNESARDSILLVDLVYGQHPLLSPLAASSRICSTLNTEQTSDIGRSIEVIEGTSKAVRAVLVVIFSNKERATSQEVQALLTAAREKVLSILLIIDTATDSEIVDIELKLEGQVFKILHIHPDNGSLTLEAVEAIMTALGDKV